MRTFSFIALIASAVPAFGQPCDIDKPPIACNDLNWRERQRELADYKGDLSGQAIALARKTFWETYPDKPGFQQARKTFLILLHSRDNSYFAGYAASENVRQLDPHVGGRSTPGQAKAYADAVNKLFGIANQEQGGIPQAARPEFDDWVTAFIKHINEHGGGVFDPAVAINSYLAMDQSQSEYERYIFARDWAEFDLANRIPASCQNPRVYAAMLYFRFGKVPIGDASNEVSSMATLLGEDVVVRAAQQVGAAPKTPAGTLVITAREPVKIGPGGSRLPDDTVPSPENVIGSFGGPLSAFEALATRDDDRRYLLGLLAELKPAPRNGSRHVGKWEYAGQGYDRYVNAFGAPEVLAASHAVRIAVKRMVDGLVMDPKAIGATRYPPYLAVDDILARKDPQGYVRWMLAFTQQLNSKTELDAAYQKFVAAKEPAVLETARKMAVRDRGPVFRVDTPEFTADADLKIMTAELNGSGTLDKPAAQTFDNPDYAAWKGFPAGAKASYIFRGMLPPRPGSNEWTGGNPSVRSTYKLQSIDDKQARLWLTEIAYDYPSGAAHPPSDSETAYPAKRPAGAKRARAGEQHESGEETLNINGRKIATRWESVSFPNGNCTIVTKTWSSDAVPGGLVRKTEDNNCGARRIIRETILDSFEGERRPGFTNVLP